MDALYRRAVYQSRAYHLADLPADEGYEVAFVGRCNAGKSSAINALTSIGKLAHISKTPGRTRQITFFGLDEQRRIADLPGYGFARVSRSLKEHWDQLLPSYLETRRSLRGLVLVMDIRHPLKPHDMRILGWCKRASMPVHILLTKADKLSRGAASATLERVRTSVAEPSREISVQRFSAPRRDGSDELQIALNRWLNVTPIV